MSVAAKLAPMQLLDPDGRPVRLGDFWKQQPVVLTFIRHFGWMLCREQVAQLRDALDTIHELGAELVVVGNGQPEHARAFREDRDLSFPLVVDPELEAYRAAGLRRGVTSTVGPGVLKSGLRALRKGHIQGRTQGDPWQQGGVFVITPAGETAFSYVSEKAGDHPETSAVLEALRRLR